MAQSKRRRIRDDAKVGTIEKFLGVIFRNKDGRKTRIDKKLANVRKDAKKREIGMTTDARCAAALVRFLRTLDAHVPGIEQSLLESFRSPSSPDDLDDLVDALRIVKELQGDEIPPEQSLENEVRQFLGMPQIP